MARVTVEDCIPVVENRFDLVLLTAQRSRAIVRGAELMVDRDNDKNPVVALRELAESKLDIPSLKENIVRSLQKHFEREQETEIDKFARRLGLPKAPDPDPDDDLLADGEGMRIVDTAAELDANVAEDDSDDSGPAADQGESGESEEAFIGYSDIEDVTPED